MTIEGRPWALPNLDPSSDAGMLDRVTATVAALVGARSGHLERVTPDPDMVEIVSAVGAAAPARGIGPRVVDARSYVLPLHLNGAEAGRIVCPLPPGAAVAPELGEQLELLACTAALALHNLTLGRALAAASGEEAERKYRVTSGMVHHLKEVLGAARDYAQLIEIETELTERQRKYLAASGRNIETAVRMMQEVLDLGRIETGRVSPDLGPIDIAAVTRSSVRDYQDAAPRVTFSILMQQELPRVRADVDLVRQVLDTLLSNAVRFTPPGHTVEVRLSTRRGRRAGDPRAWVCIDVCDEGPGVAKPEELFDELARAEALAASPGFRLAIARRMTRLLDGDLTVHARKGGGARFTIWLRPDAAQSRAEATAE